MAALLRKPLVLMPGLGSMAVLSPAADALGFSEYDSMHIIASRLLVPIDWTIVCFLEGYYHSFMPTGTCFARIPALIL